ncbi:MAG: O-antigen ligase family protein [Velocimicrobium sp.]
MSQVITTEKKISKEQIVIFFMLFPLLKPESVDYTFSGIGMLFNVGSVISAIIIIFLYLLKRKWPSKMVWLIGLIQVWVVLTTYLNQGEMRRSIIVMLSTISIVLIIDLYSYRPGALIRALFMNFEWLIYGNLLSILMYYPNGLYSHGVHGEFTCYFLGFKNSFFIYCLVAICVACFNMLLRRQFIRSLILIVASYLCVLIAWSATSITALTITVGIIMYLLIVPNTKLFEYITFRVLFVVSIVINLLVSVFNIIGNFAIVSNFIVNILHKTTNLSGRTVIWGMAATMISKKLMIGYGIGEHITWAGYDWYGHNQYFQLLLEGGIPCLTLFLLIILIIARQMEKCTGTYTYSIFMAIFCGLFTFYLVEAGAGAVFYVIFILAYHINCFFLMEKHTKPLKIIFKFRRH